MKVAVSTQGKDINSVVDARFGRTLGFIIFDTESENWEFLDNSQVLNAPQGAGIQAAKHVVDAGVNVVITGHLGPNAFKALSAAQVNAYTFKGGSVKEAIDLLKKGELQSLTNPDVEGHWV
ncbi:MAG: dinitrogenase iron-molybdenum cofactor biosynthesis protein [Candidatus Muiribacterium halophilum]|uniref:Dinitrogenase iron-molybdenum cofactor biosynthesis protein n=1 Tax=Muiribacterium halophilum TaxID=2053465 RepID=A0A2N5ZA53_MUIH1|nr:MAG: dinitrogenase iron-molybdenum cofactor biosynthesis protein [Candidatus Muirbacterium halophilum]